jgi:hypothetical protein
MKEEIIYSPIEDLKNLQSKDGINSSPIWKKCYAEDEKALAMQNEQSLYQYNIKFDGLKPVQVTNFKRLK